MHPHTSIPTRPLSVPSEAAALLVPGRFSGSHGPQTVFPYDELMSRQVVVDPLEIEAIKLAVELAYRILRTPRAQHVVGVALQASPPSDTISWPAGDPFRSEVHPDIAAAVLEFLDSGVISIIVDLSQDGLWGYMRPSYYGEIIVRCASIVGYARATRQRGGRPSPQDRNNVFSLAVTIAHEMVHSMRCHLAIDKPQLGVCIQTGAIPSSNSIPVDDDTPNRGEAGWYFEEWMFGGYIGFERQPHEPYVYGRLTIEPPQRDTDQDVETWGFIPRDAIQAIVEDSADWQQTKLPLPHYLEAGAPAKMPDFLRARVIRSGRSGRCGYRHDE